MANNKNDKENEQDDQFPGYPHYPAEEDILNQPNAERVDVDVENLSRSRLQTALPDKSVKVPAADEQPPALDDIEDIAPGASEVSEADLTPDDLVVLGEQDADFGRRDELAVTGDDLDVPGAEEDDSNEEIGEEDEENNYYSLGGDAHEDV